MGNEGRLNGKRAGGDQESERQYNRVQLGERDESRNPDPIDAEKELAEHLKRGDETALARLMDELGDHVLRTATLLLRDRYLAEDVCQETFLTAYRKIGQFRSEGSLKAWVLRIAINLCRSRMRRLSWKRLFFTDKTEELAHADARSQAAQTMPDPGSEEWTNRQMLREEIGKLSMAYREVVVLYYYHDMRTADIAEVLNEPEGTIKSKLLRARSKLRRQLEEGGWRDESFAGR